MSLTKDDVREIVEARRPESARPSSPPGACFPRVAARRRTPCGRRLDQCQGRGSSVSERWGSYSFLF